jgi:hypothetical protein
MARERVRRRRPVECARHARAKDGLPAGGLALVDARGWSERMLSATSSWFDVGDGVVIAPDPPETPTRLLTYGFDGHTGRVVDLNPVGFLSVAGRYAYSWDEKRRRRPSSSSRAPPL